MPLMRAESAEPVPPLCDTAILPAYSELKLVLPSKTPASGRRCHSEFAAPAKKEILGLVEPVERVQRPHRQFRVGGVDQDRKLDL